MIKCAETDEEIKRCFAIMSELRPHLVEDEFLPQVKSLMQEGFEMAYLEEGSEVVAVAGYRSYTNLFMGKHLYVDDLVTSEAGRSKGYGRKLLDWIRALAKERNCTHLHLDSGTQRAGAHKFYFAQGMHIASYHFSEKL